MASKTTRMKRVTDEEKKAKKKNINKSYHDKTHRITLMNSTFKKWRSARQRSNVIATDDGFAEILLGTWSQIVGCKVSKIATKTKIPQIFMRHIGTQTRKHGMLEKANQTVLSQEDINAVCGAYSEALAETSEGGEEKENSVVNNKRWRCLKSIMGCSKDTEVANVLMDWFVNTSPLMKMSNEAVTAAQEHAAGSAVRNVSDVTEPYLLTMRVTRDQEMAIQTLCTIKGWTFDPKRPVDVANMENHTWAPVASLGPPFTYEAPKPGQGTGPKPAEPIQTFQPYTSDNAQKVSKPDGSQTMVTVYPDGSSKTSAQTSRQESLPTVRMPPQQAQVFFMPMSQQVLTREQQLSGVTMLYKPQTFSTGTVSTNKMKEVQQPGTNPSPPSNVTYFKVIPNKTVVESRPVLKTMLKMEPHTERQTELPAPVLVTPTISGPNVTVKPPLSPLPVTSSAVLVTPTVSGPSVTVKPPLSPVPVTSSAVLVTPTVLEPSVTIKPPLSPVPVTSSAPGQFMVSVKQEVDDMDVT